MSDLSDYKRCVSGPLEREMRATINAQSDVIGRLRASLEKLAVVCCAGMPRSGEEFDAGLFCQICESESNEGEKLQHLLSCPLATQP